MQTAMESLASREVNDRECVRRGGMLCALDNREAPSNQVGENNRIPHGESEGSLPAKTQEDLDDISLGYVRVGDGGLPCF